jgi:lysozyme family protein
VDEIIEGVIQREGEYVDHPNDKGGETRWGITIAVAREFGYRGPMKELPRPTAAQIYRSRYVDLPRFNQILAIDPVIAAEVVDSGINAGPSRAARWFQQSLNALNQQGRHYGDIAEDGAIGPASIAAFQAYRKKRGAKGQEVLLKCLNGLQFMHYFNLTRAKSTQEDFFFGWVDHRVGAL